MIPSGLPTSHAFESVDLALKPVGHFSMKALRASIKSSNLVSAQERGNLKMDSTRISQGSMTGMVTPFKNPCEIRDYSTGPALTNADDSAY